MLVHGVRKLYSIKQTNTLIYVLDTRKLPAGRLHRASELLRKYCPYPQRQLEEYAQGEFLLHGPVSNEGNIWRAVPLAQLVVTGIFEAFPELTYGYDLLLTAVKRLRCAYFEYASIMTNHHLRILRRLAKRFSNNDNAWEGVIFVALIATRARSMTIEIETGLADEIKALRLPELSWDDTRMRATQLVVHDIPESRAFYQTLRLANCQATYVPKSPRLALERLPGITKQIWPDDRGPDQVP